MVIILLELVKRFSLKNILLTGCAGFIGSNFVSYFLQKYNEYNVINLDVLTYAGDIGNISELMSNPRHIFIEGDICDRVLVESIFDKYEIYGVIHFAAESHVDNSISDSNSFIRTNVQGTHNLIDIAFKYWMLGPFNFKKGFSNSRFLHVSTDEVYGSIENEELFTESSPYAPNSPYSASKASSDMIVRSFNKTYGMNTVITCCSNNYGPKQHDEKLIPTIIRNALNHQSIPIYGDGKNIRDWLYVYDHCVGIDLAFHDGLNGNTYNIGSNNEMTNLEILTNICSTLDGLLPYEKSYISLLEYVPDRPGHDRRYAIDSSKITNSLNWKPKTQFNAGISKTIKWYIRKYYE